MQPGPKPHESRPHQQYNEAILTKSVQLADVHGLACDMDFKAEQLFAHGILEVTHDMATIVRLAQTSRVTWSRCRMALKAEYMDSKIYANVQRHRRIGRVVDKDEAATPTDIKMYLYNKRIRMWRHHHLPFHQYKRLQVRELLYYRSLGRRHDQESARKKDPCS